MKVIVNKPAPPVTPPTTYDLVGLTEDQVKIIRIAVGAVCRATLENHDAESLHDDRTLFRLHDELKKTGVAVRGMYLA